MEPDGEFVFGYDQHPGFSTNSTSQRNGMVKGVNYLGTVDWAPSSAGTYDRYIMPVGTGRFRVMTKP